MITDVISQHRVPRRKDRIITTVLSVLIVLMILGLPFVTVQIPMIGEIFSEYLSWFVLMIVLVLVFGLNFGKHIAWQFIWRGFAEENGLRYETEKAGPLTLPFLRWPRITGVFQGYPITIECFTVGHGRYKKIYTAITLALNSQLDDGLEILSKSWLNPFKNLFKKDDSGYQDVLIDDQVFEKKYSVKSTQDRFAKNVLSTHTVRQGLLEIRSQVSDIKITVGKQSLYYQERSDIMDRAYLLAVIGVLREMASSVERFAQIG